MNNEVLLDKKRQKFYILMDGKKWETVDGYALVYKGIRMFVHRPIVSGEKAKGWRVSNYETGMTIIGVFNNFNQAIEAAVNFLDDYGIEKTMNLIKELAKKYPPPPYEGGV